MKILSYQKYRREIVRLLVTAAALVLADIPFEVCNNNYKSQDLFFINIFILVRLFLKLFGRKQYYCR